jgi:hypothetical protein
MLIAEMEVTAARDLYKAEYQWARSRFESIWNYEGLDKAFRGLWDSYCVLSRFAVEAPCNEEKRKHRIAANAYWSLYDRQCQWHSLSEPSGTIPF